MQNQTQFVDFYRSMARAAADSSKAFLQSTERLHQQQLQIVRGALEQNMKATAQLAEVKSMDELLAVQSQLIGAQVAQVTEAWRSMFRLAGETSASYANVANDAARESQPQIQVERRPEPHRKSA